MDVVISIPPGMTISYRRTVIGLVARSISEFSLHVGHNTTPQLLPDIWVDEKKLYQYRYQTTLDDGERRRYMLTFDEPLDPYESVDDFTHPIQYIAQST